MSLIQIMNLVKNYHSGGETVRAVDGVSLGIDIGEFVAITGTSGSGKSTLLTMLGGLNEPASGSIMVDGIDIYSLSVEQRADFRKEYIGFVFQAFHLLPYLNVLENVMIPLAISTLGAGEKKEKAQSLLDKVGLSNKALRLPNELSGGEQERVAIARALVNDPPIILADEPTGNLDSATSRVVMELFTRLNNEGQTVVMVTHDEQNLQYASRHVNLKDGRVFGSHEAVAG
ncbi:MAG TPA: ABC transporter ATP-binding protein [Caldithrix abyssi]|uniref:ABC transporter ATP-binding protein n=1 Tax=Caldithrix abyssi TaxID=187145 RepID=A0A7V1LJC4_CALAY|nr:ABC transporter ATP-binding protein [Caldithrix abyssi]